MTDSGRSREAATWRAGPLGPDVLAVEAPRIAALGRVAGEPNPFLEPFCLGPALAHLAGGPAEALFVESDGALVGFWVGRRRAGAAETFGHMHQFLGTPLVAAGFEADLADALCAMLDADRSGPAFIRLPTVAADGAFARALKARTEADGRAYLETHRRERALATAKGPLEDYLQARLSASRRKSLNARRRKLAETGPVAVELLSSRDDLAAWFDDFVTLEDAGWKGTAGTALARRPAERAYFAEMTAAAFDSGRLRFRRLSVGGRPVAYTIDIAAGRGLFALKIAHDPAFERCSPGVLLETEGLGAFLADTALDWIDSCAAPDHSVLSKLYDGRRALADLHVAGKGLSSRATLYATLAAERVASRLVRRAPRKEPPADFLRSAAADGAGQG